MSLAKELMGAGMSAGTAKSVGGLAGTVAAAGSVQGDATLVGMSLCTVTAADGTKGVILPAAEVGDSLTVINNSASTLKVYPPTGAAIAVPGTGMGSANASYAHTTYAVVKYMCLSATQWAPIKSA